MLAFARLFVVLVVLQVIAYFALSFWSRRVRRRKLVARWEEKGLHGDRDAFIARGLKKYDNSLRRKLILAVYFVPWIAIAALIYFVNYM